MKVYKTVFYTAVVDFLISSISFVCLNIWAYETDYRTHFIIADVTSYVRIGVLAVCIFFLLRSLENLSVSKELNKLASYLVCMIIAFSILDAYKMFVKEDIWKELFIMKKIVQLTLLILVYACSVAVRKKTQYIRN